MIPSKAGAKDNHDREGWLLFSKRKVAKDDLLTIRRQDVEDARLIREHSMERGTFVRFRDSSLIATLGCALLFGLTACGGGGGGSGVVAPLIPSTTQPATPPPATARTESDSIKSAQTGATYQLAIYLPASYGGNTKAYPVIYALDGDAVNPPSGRFENLKTILERKGIDAILVGIGGTARRSTDYTLPGAVPYHDFLTKELVPFVEAKYRTDKAKRILTGHSLSGSMTGYVLFMEGASTDLTFSHFLSFDGSYGFQQAETESLEQKMYDVRKEKTLPATLILARCSDTTQCNYQPVGAIYQKPQQRGYAGFEVVEKTYSTSHMAIDPAAFDDAIAMVFR